MTSEDISTLSTAIGVAIAVGSIAGSVILKTLRKIHTDAESESDNKSESRSMTCDVDKVMPEARESWKRQEGSLTKLNDMVAVNNHDIKNIRRQIATLLEMADTNKQAIDQIRMEINFFKSKS